MRSDFEEWIRESKLKQRVIHWMTSENQWLCLVYPLLLSFPFYCRASDVYISAPSPSSPFHHSAAPPSPNSPPCSWLPFPSWHHLSWAARAHCPLIRYARSDAADPGKTSLCPTAARERSCPQKPETNRTVPLQTSFDQPLKS